MVIDIISYTEAQFAELTDEQLIEVKSAQLKKNALDRKLQDEIEKEKHRLVDNGIFNSEIWNLFVQKRQEQRDADVEFIRASLLFYLQYSYKVEESGSAPPYKLDYRLSEEERYIVVRDFYMEHYDDPEERLNAFKSDKVAKSYLGEWYGTAYNYISYFV
jgi:hypothetical protein